MGSTIPVKMVFDILELPPVVENHNIYEEKLVNVLVLRVR